LTGENHARHARLEGGLQKLIDAAEAVAAFGEELATRKGASWRSRPTCARAEALCACLRACLCVVVVDQKRKEVQEMIVAIQERSGEVEVKRREAKEKEEQLHQARAALHGCRSSRREA
jgi:hypothetical protein